MKPFPQNWSLDDTLPLFRDGYLFISNKCDQLKSRIFITRLLLRKTICMKGAEACQLFYDNDKFVRHGAMPLRAQKTLVGVGGVQALDGKAHKHRKELFVRCLMDTKNIAQLAELHKTHWLAALKQWPLNKELILFDLAQNILCRSVCAWAGVSLPEDQLEKRAKEFGLMIDSGAQIGFHHWRGRLARKSSEAWITDEIKKTREKDIEQNDSIFQSFAWHRDEDGQLLPPKIAAVELINVLRPTVAIAQLVAFSALAIHQYPQIKEKFRDKNPDYLEWFVLEVRRFYPFFPFLAAYTCKDFVWKDYTFKKGTWTLLDIYGTNHDDNLWKNADTFNPERFREWNNTSYNFVANGGATYHQHHRCPGEWITNSLMKVIIQVLVENLEYKVPDQDLRFSMRSIPTLPKSRVVIQPLKFNDSVPLKFDINAS